MQYRCVDVVKFIMAVFVVGIHVNSIDRSGFPAWLEYMVRMAVPFFFVTSGYLLESKIQKEKANEFSIYRSSIKKFTERYLLWTLIYIPLNILAYLGNGEPWYTDIFIFVRGVLLVGEFGYSWPLWYLLAMIIAVAIIYFLRFNGWNFYHITLLGLSLMFCGMCYNKINSETLSGVPYTLWRIYEMSFVTTRNGFFQGLGSVSIGISLWHIMNQIKLRQHLYLLAFLLLLISITLYSAEIPFWALIGGCSIFLITSQISLSPHKIYILLRKQSMVIYFIHMYIVILLNYLRFYHIIQLNNLYLYWGIATLGSALLSYLLLRFSETQQGRFLKHLL